MVDVSMALTAAEARELDRRVTEGLCWFCGGPLSAGDLAALGDGETAIHDACRDRANERIDETCRCEGDG